MKHDTLILNEVNFPFKRRLGYLPTPLGDDILSAYAHSNAPKPFVDLWEDKAAETARQKVDTVRLYQHLFKPNREHFSAAKGFKLIAPLSHHVRNMITKNYQTTVNREGLQVGLEYLRKTIEKLLVVWRKYPFHDIASLGLIKQVAIADKSLVEATHFSAFELLRTRKSKPLKAAAANIAAHSMQVIKTIASEGAIDALFTAYDAAAQICQRWGVIPPYWHAVKQDCVIEAAECALLRMSCAKWWAKQLGHLRDQCCEHLCIAVGLVNRQSPYVSDECFSEWTSQQRTAMQWLESTMIENEDGVILPLIEAAMAGNANPSNRLVELIVRARGLDEMACEQGYIGFMVTLTCPSKYHNVSHKWNCEAPKIAQQYLVKLFSKIRSALSYRNIPLSGCRVAEPHQDGTPHWHMLCFIKPEHEAAVRDIFTKYALAEDGDEPGAKQHRIEIKPIDKDAGSAVGYIIKYLSKGISGEHMQGELDLECGKPVEEATPRVASWASRHRLRQFQFYGTSSVQIWRELRRIKIGPQSPEIEAAKAAACNSDWKGFEEAMKDAQLKLNYEVTPLGNAYGEMTRRVHGVEGVAFGKKKLIITRGERWKLRQATDDERSAYKTLKQRRAELFAVERTKKPEDKLSRAELKAALPKWSMALLPSLFGSPWTCRNNCTDPVLEQVDSRIIRHLAQVGITDPANIERLLFDGCRVMDADGGEWWVDDGQLRNEPYRYADIEDIDIEDLLKSMQSVLVDLAKMGALWAIDY